MHFGAPDPAQSREREKRFVAWLDHIQPDTKALYLLGDIFDFWFEYKRAVPRGYVRLLGKLAEFSDAGIPVHIFTGNHDLWYRDYLEEEISAHIHRGPLVETWMGKTYYLAHGDGLGPGDHGYKFMKRVITHPLSRWLFARLHPNFGIGLAYFFSQKSRLANKEKTSEFLGEQEFLVAHARAVLNERTDIDHFVFGHRHHYQEVPLGDGKTLLFLGDWIRYFSYLRIGPEGPKLRQWG
jgi:UDP-2,3-diacylglucosamine hydrolase